MKFDGHKVVPDLPRSDSKGRHAFWNKLRAEGWRDCDIYCKSKPEAEANARRAEALTGIKATTTEFFYL